ncbi:MULTISPECIES: SapC family protein [unclassified Caulobacter]|uniref:SapC family protein n=1 Tax=unclassified Caulobacter TaxID=2648921 RepID=UPI0004A6ABA3|nr:SapC family protein [Caulobacter sp. UNC358MFTsu5.1]
MTNRVLLNNVDHGDLRVATGHGPAFGDDINQVLIFPTEFEAVQREYPIFFRKDAEGAFQSVALLGLDRDENLFLEPGGWNARYVPAIQQRGPFSIALRDRGAEPMIHVDLDHPRVGAADGEPVFLPAGGNSPYLQHVARLLGVIYDGLEFSKAMFAAFEAHGLVEPVDVEIKLDDYTQYDLPELYTISQDRFAALDAAGLEALHRSGFLAAAQWVLSSLGNVGFLVELKNRKRAGA